MKILHSIRISVFSKPEEDEEKIRQTLLLLMPFDMEKEKIELSTQNAKGFNERKIKIFEIHLQKQRHIDPFFDNLKRNLTDDQKTILSNQKESRLDEHLNFFLRLDKEKLHEGKFFLTDEGNCYHIKFSIAAFPARREIALKVIDKMFE